MADSNCGCVAVLMFNFATGADVIGDAAVFAVVFAGVGELAELTWEF